MIHSFFYMITPIQYLSKNKCGSITLSLSYLFILCTVHAYEYNMRIYCIDNHTTKSNLSLSTLYTIFPFFSHQLAHFFLMAWQSVVCVFTRFIVQQKIHVQITSSSRRHQALLLFTLFSFFSPLPSTDIPSSQNHYYAITVTVVVSQSRWCWWLSSSSSPVSKADNDMFTYPHHTL